MSAAKSVRMRPSRFVRTTNGVARQRRKVLTRYHALIPPSLPGLTQQPKFRACRTDLGHRVSMLCIGPVMTLRGTACVPRSAELAVAVLVLLARPARAEGVAADVLPGLGRAG